MNRIKTLLIQALVNKKCIGTSNEGGRKLQGLKSWAMKGLWKHPMDRKVVTDHLPALNLKQKQEGMRLQPYLPNWELLLNQFPLLPSLQSCDNLWPVCLQLSILRPSLVFILPCGELFDKDEFKTMVNFLLLNSPDQLHHTVRQTAKPA